LGNTNKRLQAIYAKEEHEEITSNHCKDVAHKSFVSRPATEKVYLAVGNDEKQCEFFLLWAKNFIPPQKPLVVLHIYRPATTIPHVGLGAPMVASMLREDLVRDYRKDERDNIKISLKKCLQNCKVNAESGCLQCFHFSAKSTLFHLCYLGPSKDADY